MKKVPLRLKVSARRLSNPVFFALLLLAFILWYVIKLSHTYTTDISIPVRIDENYYTVKCNVEGVGYVIVLHNMAPRRNLVKISSDNVELTTIDLTSGTYEISSFTLQNYISSKITDLKINSVESPVRIELPAEEEEGI